MLFGYTASAQDPVYSQYMFNSLALNPGYTGNKGLLNVNGYVRSQWIGVKGSPKSQTLTGDMLLGDERSGVGVIIKNDGLGAQSALSVSGSYAYWLPLNNDLRLSFGLSAGFYHNTLNASRLTPDNEGDPALTQTNVSELMPDANAGFFLTNDIFYAGLSATRILTNSTRKNDRSYLLYSEQNYYLTSGYVFELNELKLYPSMLMKFGFNTPAQLDISSSVLIEDMFWVGGSFRFVTNSPGKQLSLYSRFTINDRYQLGYSFDYDISRFRRSLKSTHEISLTAVFDFGNERSRGLKSYF